MGRAEEQKPRIDPVLTEDAEERWKLVRAHCTSCHSSRILQHLRLSRESWQDVIKRMKEDEGLWDLGKDESSILEYLVTYFGPASESPNRPRRAPLATNT